MLTYKIESIKISQKRQETKQGAGPRIRLAKTPANRARRAQARSVYAGAGFGAYRARRAVYREWLRDMSSSRTRMMSRLVPGLINSLIFGKRMKWSSSVNR